jgi:hypothetical protein
MFFDVRFFTYVKHGKCLIAHFPCINHDQLNHTIQLVNEVDSYDYINVSIIADRTIELYSTELIHYTKEKLP